MPAEECGESLVDRQWGQHFAGTLEKKSLNFRNSACLVQGGPERAMGLLERI